HRAIGHLALGHESGQTSQAQLVVNKISEIMLERRIAAEILFDIAAVLDDRYRWDGLRKNFSFLSLDQNLNGLEAMTSGADCRHFFRQPGGVQFGEIGSLVVRSLKHL